MHFPWPSLRFFRSQTSADTQGTQFSQRHGGAEHCDTVERSPSGDAETPTTSPVVQALQPPERRRAVAGTQATVAGPAAPAAGALAPPSGAPQGLTLAALDAWAAAPHQSPQEQVERQRVVDLLTTPSFFPIRRRCLKLPKNLSLDGCTSLSSLPEGLKVGGGLYLDGCTSLSSLPEGLKVGGSLNLYGCTSLSSLPEGLTVGGSLYLDGCRSLSSLPEGLKVGGFLHLRDSTSLLSLPEGLKVGGLNLRGCTSLSSLPEGLKVGGLDLRGCTSLSSLPEGLKVGGYLELRGCTSLSSLPEGLTVGEGLYLDGCTSLSSLPERLRVVGSLNLDGCTSLSSLPEGLTVGGFLDLSDCTSLSALPESILRWSPMRNGQPHNLYITGSGLSAAVVASIQRTAGPGVQVVFGAGREYDAQAGFVDLAAARAFWQPLVADGAARGAPPGPIVAEPHELHSLLLFLGRLQDTADFRNAHSRPLLAGRVLGLLQRMQGAPEVAALCHERIGQALESCGDRVIWAMNQLELALRTHDAQSTAAPEAALRSLGTALVRLEVVHRHAADRCAALRVVDPIEVYLAYETALAGPLQLPLSTQGMLYAGLSNVTEGDIEKARQAAMQAGDDAQRVEAYLRAWAPWQAHLRRTETADVERVWRGLVPAPAPAALDDDDCCTITQNTWAELRASGSRSVAVVGHEGRWQVYDFAALLTWYRQHGTHPMHVARPLRLEDVRSLPDA